MHEARCSFCDKPASAVKALIKAPKTARKGQGEIYICTECVRASAAIFDSDDGEKLLGITKEPLQ
jgi:ClpX C4-type zinc finger